MKAIDLSGRKFTRLLVLSLNSVRVLNGTKNCYWNCICDCGTLVVIRSGVLNKGEKRSCGCLHREQLANRNRSNAKHGLRGHRLYNVWREMIARCTNTNHKHYKDWGGRGISVCDRWMDVRNFISDMDGSWQEGLQIERRNNVGNYCPENCLWETRKRQGRNKRNNVLLTLDGVTRCVAEWSEILNIPDRIIRGRLKSMWTPEECLTIPAGMVGFKRAQLAIRCQP